MNSDTIEETDTTAERLRNALVDQIVQDGRVRTPCIEVAMRTVPRHVFVPDASLEEAYADSTVNIKQDSDGTSISCASQPGVVGLMLEQLQPKPGDNVLELGAGTGYNVALLAHLVSIGSEMNTFMPLRRGIADDDRRMIAVASNGSVRLQTNSEQPVDADALADVLNQPGTVVWSDVFYRAMESPEWMELWLSCTLPSGLNQMPFKREAVGSLLSDDPYPSSTATFDKGSLSYLARRLSSNRTPEGGKLWEFGVVGHGSGGDELAERVADSMRTWDREYRHREAQFEILPLNAAPVEPSPGRFSFDTPLNRIVVEWR